MPRKKLFFYSIIAFTTITILFFGKCLIELNPDLGWHIRMGDYILRHGVPSTDPLSYSMTHFPFIDHEWLSNVLLALLFPFIGTTGLSFLFASLTSVILFLQYYIAKEKSSGLLVCILAAGILLSFVGIRPQIFTWFFFLTLLIILHSTKSWQRWKFFLPIIFLLWTNLHGGFALGIAILFFASLMHLFKKGSYPGIIKVLILSLLATGATPYGFRIWEEIWRQMTDTQLHWAIYEWMPPIFFTNFPFFALLIISVPFIVIFRKQLQSSFVFIFIILLVSSLSSMRHIPLWTILTLILLNDCFNLFMHQISQSSFGLKQIPKIYIFSTIGIIILFILQTVLTFKHASALSETNYYPKQAINFIRTHPYPGNIFTQYTWGGYLDWKLPEKKVFIDGRMPSWRWDKQYPAESSDAFAEYRLFMQGRIPFISFTKRYSITRLLLPVNQPPPPDKNIRALPAWIRSLLEQYLFIDLLQTAKKEGWQSVYSDSKAIILQKPYNKI